MDNGKKFGFNRTGINVARLNAKEMKKGAERLTRCPPGSDSEIGRNRERFMASADSVGSIPMPGTVKGAVSTSIQLLKGNDPKTLVDKLGERLAFERTGVRLYDSLLSKREAMEDAEGIFPIDVLQRFREEEYKHFLLLEKTIEDLGGDPTAVTPSADIAGVSAAGLVQVLGDPRTQFTECLSAILIAELADNDSWSLLIQLVEDAGLDRVADEFRQALKEENAHLSTIRDWVQRSAMGESREEKWSA